MDCAMFLVRRVDALRMGSIFRLARNRTKQPERKSRTPLKSTLWGISFEYQWLEGMIGRGPAGGNGYVSSSDVLK